MKYYIFSEVIDSEKTSDLLDFLNETEGPVTIGLNSSGGSCAVSYFLLMALNSMKDRITLVGVSNVFSAAFDLWYHFEGRKDVMDETIGMLHLGYLPDRQISSTGIMDDLTKVYIPIMKAKKKANDKWVKTVLTPQEFKNYNRNKDIYINTDRMQLIAKIHNDRLKE